MPKGIPKAKSNEPENISSTSEDKINVVQGVVSKDEFDNFKQTQGRVNDKILNLLENLAADKGQAVEANKAVQEEVVDDNGAMPLQYQRIFEKYFDVEDGFSGRLNFPEVDEKGNEMGGIMFTIVVPRKFSNATSAYLDYYKADLRSKPLQPGAVAKGIEEWCKKVANNLKYNKLIKTK